MKVFLILVLGAFVSSSLTAAVSERPLIGGEAMLSAAQAAEAKSDWPDAVRRYQALIDRYPGGEYAARALGAIAAIQANHMKEPEAAANTFQSLISELPNANPMATYSAAQQLITLSGQLNRPELKCKAYQAMLDTMKGSSNRASWYSGLIRCAIARDDQASIKRLLNEMFEDCSQEPGLRANAETVAGDLDSSAGFKELAADLRRRIDQLPSGPNPAEAMYKEYQALAESKDYAGAIAKADELAKAFTKSHYTHSACISAQAIAESQLKDWSINQRMCKLAAMAMQGPGESGTLELALSYWVRASLFLKDLAGVREAADYALAHFPHSSATDDVLLQAAKAPLQKGAAWTDIDTMQDALSQIRLILEKYPGGTAELEAKWLEKRLVKMIALERQASST